MTEKEKQLKIVNEWIKSAEKMIKRFKKLKQKVRAGKYVSK